MKKVREQLDAFRDARTWPREVRVRVHSIYRSVRDLRQPIGDGDRFLQAVPARGADLAEILGEDDVGFQVVEQNLVDLIKALAGREVSGDGAIDFFLRETLQRQRGFADHWQRTNLGRIVALV